MALLVLDIDQFRRVNDALGHTVGDRLLDAVAERLRQALERTASWRAWAGTSSPCSRRGWRTRTPPVYLPSGSPIAWRSRSRLDDLPLDVTAAIGVAIYPDHGSDSTTLLRHAEVAMYDAKDHGSTSAIYTPEAEQHTPEKLELLADLRRTLDQERTSSSCSTNHKWSWRPREVVGTEALLRWNHPERGFVSPEVLIKSGRANRRDAPDHLPGASRTQSANSRSGRRKA